MSLTTSSFKTVPTNTQIYPKIPLSEEKIEVVLRDLRQALDNKKISFHEFIKMIDVNDIGFITINDFSSGLDKVIKFSQHAKDGLFAYIDKLKIGMINYADFLKILKRSVTEKKIVPNL
jgi:Ca2+-binding EF-hand superfamily protein